MSSPAFGSVARLNLNSKLIGVLDSKKLTLSTWFKYSGVAAGVIFTAATASATKIAFGHDTDGTLSLSIRNSSGTLKYLATTASAYNDDTWHHLVISVDLGATTVNWRLDRAAPTLTVTTAPADATIPFESCVKWVVGSNSGGTANYPGALYDFIFKAGEYVDITDSDVLKLFVSSDGRAVSGSKFWQNVGPNAGIKPIGYGVGAPIFNGEKADIYFSNCFQYNQGVAGAFVLTSTFDTTADPDVYRSAAHYDSKERWYESDRSGFSYTRSRTFIEQREGHPSRGLRMGIDERDEKFRQDNPSATFNQLLFNDTEDDSAEKDR